VLEYMVTKAGVPKAETHNVSQLASSHEDVTILFTE
jgi:hypothetical protein